MLFASILGDPFLDFLLFLGLGLWGFKRVMSKFGGGGLLKGAAKKGASSLLKSIFG